MEHRIGKKIVSGIFLIFAGCLVLTGCLDLPPVKQKVKGPWVSDSLTGKKVQGVSDNGTFTEAGWSPGKTGTLTYEVPALSQGVIEFDVKGLNRNTKDTVLLTMYEKIPFEYPNPYIINNPFRVTLSIKNYERYPSSPFEFLWTLKNFPATTSGDDRYVKGLPNGVEGIEKSILSNNIPVFPDQISKLKIEWMHGIARFYVNQQLAGEINYQPYTYNPKNLRVVFGKTPGADSFDSPDLVFSNIRISFPKL